MTTPERRAIEKVTEEVSKALVKRSPQIAEEISENISLKMQNIFKEKVLPDFLPEAERMLRQAVYERLKSETELVRSERVVEMKKRHRDIEKAEMEQAKLYALPACARIDALIARTEEIRSLLLVTQKEAQSCVIEANDIVAKVNSHSSNTKFSGPIRSYDLDLWFYTETGNYAATFDHLVPFLNQVKIMLRTIFTSP